MTRSRPVLLVGAGLSGWALLALVSAAQGVLFSWSAGAAQPWWPTLGYSAAIFSVWALLTPPLMIAADRIAAAARGRIALHVAGLPIAVAAHLLLFVALYRPMYGADVPPLAMARAVLFANIDTASFAYLTLIGAAFARRRLMARGTPARAAVNDLWVRARGTAQRLAVTDIDWIGAAGDYAEVHAGGRCHLVDHSLARLVGLLPADDFVRIHRGTIVRIDRVRSVTGIGRGDAEVRLDDGTSLRLSRRYRGELARRLPA